MPVTSTFRIKEPIDEGGEVKDITEPLVELAKKILGKTKGNKEHAKKILVEEYGVPVDWVNEVLKNEV